MKPARSRCTGGRNASISRAKMVGGQAWGSSTVFPWAFLKGFAASSLRRYWEMLLTMVCAVPRTRGSSLCPPRASAHARSEEHTSELQSLAYLVCRLLLEKKKKKKTQQNRTA